MAHLGVEQPVVAAFHPLLHRGLQPGQSPGQHRLAAGALLQGQPFEAVGAGGEGLEEAFHQLLLPTGRQQVEGEGIPHVQEAFQGPVARHRQGEAGRVEAGLTHPAGHHRTAGGLCALAAPHGDDREGADHPAEGLEGRVGAAFLQSSAGVAEVAAPLVAEQASAQGHARFLQGAEGGGIGAEAHPDGIEGEGEAAVPQLGLQQIDRLATPAEAAEHPHRFAPIPLRQHGAEGGDDRGGGMAAEGGGADQQGVAAADRLQPLLRLGEFAVEALHPHTAAGHPAGEGIGDGGGVAVGAGVEQGHREAGAPLALPPAAIVGQQAAPAVADRRAMEGGDGANRQVVEAIEHHVHLAGHRGHQAVVEPAAVLLGAAAVGFREGLDAEGGGEELAAHQQAGALLEGHQGAGPAGGGGGKEPQAQGARQGAGDLLLDDLDGGQGPRRGRFRGAGGGGPPRLPQLPHQLGAGVGGHQGQLRPALQHRPQQLHPVGVDHPHHHLEGSLGRHPLRQGGEEGLGVGHAGGVNQHRWHGMAVGGGARFEEEAIGAGAALEAVLHLEAQALGAEAAEAEEAGVDRQGDDPPRSLGGGAG